jgi:asparagine synthetase B (glutamine-hydrolysing)
LAPWILFREYCIKPALPQPLKQILKRLVRSPARAAPRLVRAEFMESSGANDWLRNGNNRTRFPTRSQQVVYNALFSGWNHSVGRDSTELLRGRFGLESRRPFLDRRLVEFALAVPPDQLWRGAEAKMVLRNAMKGILPEPVRQRRGKAIYVNVFDKELTEWQADSVDKVFRNSILQELGAMAPGRATELWERYRTGGQFLSTTHEIMLMLELQVRRILADGAPPVRSAPAEEIATHLEPPRRVQLV